MSPFPAMAASLQSSPHIYSVTGWRYSQRSAESGNSIHHRNYRHLYRRTVTFSCQRRTDPQESANPRQTRIRTVPVTERFASISSSRSKETTSVGVPPQQPIPPPSSSVGSPLFWIGVGVGLSALFSFVATNLKKYAMQQAFKAMMGQMNPQNTPNSPFSTPGFPPLSPSPFAAPSTPGATYSPVSAPKPQPVTVDVPASKVEAPKAEAAKVEAAPIIEETKETKAKEEPKKYAFVDVSPEEPQPKSPFESFSDVAETTSSKDAAYTADVSQNGAAFKSDTGAFGGQNSFGKGLSVDALEKMMEDPIVQKMVYPYLPEEMRNPETFKWMMQNPQYRQQLEEMLNNMGGSNEWDNRMMDSLKNFDLSSPEVKQQFDQIGLTPEQVISKIMANPDVAMAFQNPRVQQAIMDCSQNPLSIAKYQNDKEVMDVFNKISELFPGVTGP